MKLKSFVTCVLLFWVVMSTASNIGNMQNYLYKPTGQYGVGFKDFHWINQRVCPDFNFNGKNSQDFSSTNITHCHEMMVRIYYPSAIQQQSRSLYYRPFIELQQQAISKTVPGISKEQLEELVQIKSFSVKNAENIKDKKFPILFFSPGFGCPSQLYENFITHLVSQGYIVVSINTPFINLTELPNGRVVNPARPENSNEIEQKFVPLQAEDLSYAYHKIYALHDSDPLFASMDLNHIGAFGHSIGARVVADVTHLHPKWFQAAATLDIGVDTTGASLKEFSIPFMHVVSANRMRESVMHFELGTHGYLVGISPDEKNYNYSHHMNFSDLSTLQYVPALEKLQDYTRQHALDGVGIKLLSHDPTQQDLNKFDKTTFTLIKQGEQWGLYVYLNKTRTTEFKINLISGLDAALAHLPGKPIEQLSVSEIYPVKRLIMNYYQSLMQITGTGNGWEITSSINTYLSQFFNKFLKGEKNQAFEHCKVLSNNTYIKCGPN